LTCTVCFGFEWESKPIRPSKCWSKWYLSSYFFSRLQFVLVINQRTDSSLFEKLWLKYLLIYLWEKILLADKKKIQLIRQANRKKWCKLSDAIFPMFCLIIWLLTSISAVPILIFPHIYNDIYDFPPLYIFSHIVSFCTCLKTIYYESTMGDIDINY